MEFLNKSFYDNNGDLEGFVLTEYTEGERPVIRGCGLDEFKATLREQECIGFRVDENNVLYSDSVDCYPVHDVGLTYIINDVNSTPRRSDIIDIMLFGIKYTCGILRSYESGITDPTKIMLAKSFKVSGSTYNIYAKYMNDDGEFRTFSLFDTETGNGVEFYFVVPSDVNIPANLIELLTKVDSHYDVNGLDCNVYRSVAQLKRYPYLGGAFVNYVAHNAAYYTQGETTILKYHKQCSDKDKAEKLLNLVKPLELPKKKLSCVAIKHTLNGKNRYEDVSALFENVEALTELVNTDYCARVAYEFLYDISESVQFYTEQGSQYPVSSACMNMVDKCSIKALIYNLELLSIRYSIDVSDTFLLPVVLKGGGVYGDSTVKRIIR